MEAAYALEPWGEVRDNLHAGIIASAAVSPWLGKGTRPPNPADWLLQTGGNGEKRVDAKQRRDEMWATLKAFAESRKLIRRRQEALAEKRREVKAAAKARAAERRQGKRGKHVRRHEKPGNNPEPG